MITTRTMVFETLKDNSGKFLSVSELRTLIFEKFSTNMNLDTIVHAIDEIKHIKGDIGERVERRGKLNLPVKVFGLEFNVE